MMDIGLVMQGGGALGAYEYGAVTCLVEAGFKPVAVTGVSIGAINAAAIAGARDGDVAGSLRALWDAITLAPVPFVPADRQDSMSMFGNPGFWSSRRDWYNAATWTSLCDVSAMRRTLDQVVDFGRINDAGPDQVRLALTALNVGTGESVRFSNQKMRITADHVLASGSLPPAFPMTEIDGQQYWDGGLFDNTPLRPLVEMLTPEQTESLPIVVLDLFPSSDAIPGNMIELKNRMMEVSFENRFWDAFGGPAGVLEYAKMLASLDAELPPRSKLRQNAQFQRMMEYRALRNLNVIPAAHVPMTGGMDFSAYGVKRRFDTGYAAVEAYLAERPLTAPAPALAAA